jgi:hypothetical protein
MKSNWIKRFPYLLLCLGLVTAVTAQSSTPSVLDLVQNVDDPELGELVRLAIENQAKFHSLTREETLGLPHKVTLSYTQIELFNQQIQEVSRKIEETTGPVEMRHSLLMAKTELEAKRTTEVAHLRKIMGITPRHPFDKKPVTLLNTWLHLHVLDQGVHVLNSLKPYSQWWGRWRLKSSGLLSKREALDLVSERLRKKTNLPIRIDLRHTRGMLSSAEDLRRKVVSLAIESNCQMETEVNLKLLDWVGSGESTFFIRGGTISTLYAGGNQIKLPDGSKRVFTGIVEPSDLDQHILWRLMHPGNIPLKYRIEHDETSSKLARQAADKIKAFAKDMGIGELVELERILVELVPESTFLGWWQAITKGEVQIIDIQPNGVCVFVQSPGSKLIRDGMSSVHHFRYWILLTHICIWLFFQHQPMSVKKFI